MPTASKWFCGFDPATQGTEIYNTLIRSWNSWNNGRLITSLQILLGSQLTERSLQTFSFKGGDLEQKKSIACHGYEAILVGFFSHRQAIQEMATIHDLLYRRAADTTKQVPSLYYESLSSFGKMSNVMRDVTLQSLQLPVMSIDSIKAT